MILLDTYALIWLLLDDQRLGGQTRQIITRAWSDNYVGVSAITFWEIAMLYTKGRLEFLVDIGLWRVSLLNEGLAEVPVDGEIALRAGSLRDLHGDPADRIIVATALTGHQLVTADQRILEWSGQLNKLDATK
jgi:PIN domain nuclease of toxin-antitoxin system